LLNITPVEITITEASSTEGVVTTDNDTNKPNMDCTQQNDENERAEGVEINCIKPLENVETADGIVAGSQPIGEEDSSGAGPRDSISSSDDEEHDGDLTLDDATDITLDDSTGSPIPPIPHDNKQVNEEDEYYQLARSGHYENMDFKLRPNALIISKRRLQALHPPKLDVVKYGLNRAWITMKSLGTEGARKINEWARESTVLHDNHEVASNAAATCTNTSRATSELPTSPEGTPPPVQPRANPPRAAKRRSGHAARHSRYLPHEV
jgi:hypothetical protein